MPQQRNSLQTLDVMRPVAILIIGDWESEIGGKMAVLVWGDQGSDGFMDQNLA